MQIPSRYDSGKLLDTIHTLKEIESGRSTEDKRILSMLFEEKISQKEAMQLLKNKTILKASKDIDNKIIKTFIEYNSQLVNICRQLEVNNPKIRDLVLAERSNLQKAMTSLKLIFGLKKEKIKMPIEIISKKKEVHPEIPVIDKEISVTKKKAFLKIKLGFPKIKLPLNIKKSKTITTEAIPIVEPATAFIPPKEVLPENYQILIPGFAYAFVQEKEGDRMYVVAEPDLTSDESKILQITKDELINKISLEDLNNETQMYKQVEKAFQKNKIKITDKQKEKIIYYIVRQINGLDKIEPLMHDPLIEDIECDGIKIPIFIVHRKYGHIVTNISFDTEKELQQFVIKMAHLCRSYVSYASPLLDSILPDGSRVNATLTSNISTRGPTFTIRKFPQKPLTAIDLINYSTINTTIAAYLWTIIEFRKTVLIIGPTAAGKTTLLNVITSFIPPAQRVVSIEDTREINLLMDNWVPQITRPGFGPPDSSGKRYGEVTMQDLLKESFRQRPDYLIIGEVRGEEISLMFQGMASGHCCISTVHSRSVNDLVSRLTTPPISLDPSLLRSLDVVIVAGMSGTSETEREIKEIDEIRDYNVKEDKLEYNAIYKSSERMSTKKEGDLFTNELPITYKSDVLKTIAKDHNIDVNDLLDLITARVAFLEELIKKNPPKDYIEFKLALNLYKRKEKIDIW